MKKIYDNLTINLDRVPSILFFGNGMLKLNDNGTSWNDLLKSIKTIPIDVNVEGIPYAMQPEALSGYDVEEIQRRTAEKIETLDDIPQLVKSLLEIPFDAILTTNYTYEIEMILSGYKWNENRRRQSFTALDGRSNVRHNTFVCNIVKTPDGRKVPVFHIHGEKARKHSLVLSYYSYAKSLFELTNYNKNVLKDKLFELQSEHKDKECVCWLDYFLMGNVYAVGFGFDVSEFDVWWAIERKAREHAEHGRLKAYMEADAEKDNAQRALFNALDVESSFIQVKDKNYAGMYEQIINDIKENI